MGLRSRDRWWHPASGFPSCPNCRQDYPGVRGHNEAWWEVDIKDGWLAALRLAQAHGDVVVAEIRIFPNHLGSRDGGTWCVEWAGVERAVREVPRGGLTAAKIDNLAVENELKKAKEALEKFHQFMKDSRADLEQQENEDEMPLVISGMPAAAKSKYHRKIPGSISNLALARLAVRYEQLCAEPQVLHVNESLAQEINESTRRTTKLIYQARERGFLSGGGRGKTGGHATDTAHAILLDYERMISLDASPNRIR